MIGDLTGMTDDEAIEIAAEIVDEWDPLADPHGYVHVRPVIERLLGLAGDHVTQRRTRTSTRVPNVVTGPNDVLIERIAPLYFPATARTLDLTYGRGIYWKRYRPEQLTTNDLDPDKATDYHYDYRHTGFESGSFDRILLDPSYVATGGRHTSTLAARGSDMIDRYDMHATETNPWLQHVNVVGPAIREAARLLAPGGALLVKCQDYVTSKVVQPGVTWARTTGHDAGLIWWDTIIHVTGLRPQPSKSPSGKPIIQEHAHGAHSVLLVFNKPSPPKPRPRSGANIGNP